MIKLIDILKEISINLNNSYPYNLSKNRNVYTADFTTEDDYRYRYIGEVNNKILGTSFEMINRPEVEQDIEKTEKNIKDVWLQVGLNPRNHTKEFFDFETKKGVLNVDGIIKWDDLWIPIKESKTFINYIKSNFSSFNGKPIDLNNPSSYDINALYTSLEDKKVKGHKITSGNEELIISFNEKYKFITFYYKLNLVKLNKKLLSIIKSYITSLAKGQHIGTHVITNKGNLFKIMNTIFQISKEIIDSNNKIKYIGFTPALTTKEKNNDISLSQSKRTKLYDLYIKNIYPNSYQVTDEELEKLPYSDYRIIYKILK